MTMTTPAREVEAWLREQEREYTTPDLVLSPRVEALRLAFKSRADSIAALIAECEEARERTRAILKLHYLTGIHCNHERGTDRASCWCSQWRGTEQPSVGAAVDEWIEHVLSEYDKLFAPPPQPVPVSTRELITGEVGREFPGEEKGETNDPT